MHKKMVTLSLALLFFTVIVHSQIPNEQQFNFQLDSMIKRLMEKLPVIPAISVTVVNENGAVFNKAYGWANKEAGIKADLNTEFYIASATKSFTALAAALIDQEKKILLDSPMKKYFSKLHFKADIGNDVTVRTLLTHTSGLENSPLTFRLAYTGSIARNDILHLLADATSVREKPGQFKYDNLGYNIYGLALQEYLHLNWQDVLQEKIFKPLGMKKTTAYISAVKKNNWNMAMPYDAFGKNGVARIELEKSDSTMQSAGGVVTTPTDIALWIQAQINYGKINNRQLLPENVVRMTQTGVASYDKGSGIFTAPGKYGLGWQVSEYRNQKIIYHFGGYPGYRAHISFMPGKKVGLAVFTNEGTIGSSAPDLIAAFVYDWITNASDPAFYSKKLDELQTSYNNASQNNQRSYAERAKRTWQLSMPLKTYTGKYHHDLYGDIDVSVENNVLAVKMGNLHAVSTPFTEKETIRVELIPGTGRVVAFKMDNEPKVTGLTYDNLEFKRVQ